MGSWSCPEDAWAKRGARRYPDQEQGWQLVHVGKWACWALPVSLSFVLVVSVKMQEGRCHGEVGTVPAVTRGVRRPRTAQPGWWTTGCG